jgi:hypothetical protein
MNRSVARREGVGKLAAWETYFIVSKPPLMLASHVGINQSASSVVDMWDRYQSRANKL